MHKKISRELNLHKTAVLTILSNALQILAALGVKLPWSEDVSFFLFYGAYLAAQFAVYYFLRGRVEVTYALAYDALRPRERQENGVVLGNIFQM